jgi:hypothetical protein
MRADKPPLSPASMSARGRAVDPKTVAHPLTANEAKVASSLFGAFLEPEEERIRRMGLPRSSYRDAKRQLFALRILEDRYLPHPSLVGGRRVSFFLGRPHAEEIARVASALTELRGSASVWAGTQSVFALIYHPTAESAAWFRDTVEAATFGTPVSLVQVEGAGADVPVFFDFEGAWNHLCGVRGTEAYPRPMLGSSPLPRRYGSRDRIRQMMETLWNRKPVEGPDEATAHPQGPGALPRTQRLLIRDGAVEWRVVPNLASTVRTGDAAIESVIYSQGELNPGHTPVDLFRDLTENCEVAPFVYAYELNRVFLASLGLGPGQRRALGADALPRPSVRATLLRHLSKVETLREPAHSLKLLRMLKFG